MCISKLIVKSETLCNLQIDEVHLLYDRVKTQVLTYIRLEQRHMELILTYMRLMLTHMGLKLNYMGLKMTYT